MENFLQAEAKTETLDPPPILSERKGKKGGKKRTRKSRKKAPLQASPSIGFQGYTIVRVAWRRGKERGERYQTGPSYTNHPALHVYTYTYRVSFKRHAKGSGTEEKGMRRQDELVSLLAWCRSSLEQPIPPLPYPIVSRLPEQPVRPLSLPVPRHHPPHPLGGSSIRRKIRALLTAETRISSIPVSSIPFKNSREPFQLIRVPGGERNRRRAM